MYLLKIISLLPFGVLYRIADGLYYLLWHVIKYRREVVLNNLRHAFPDKEEEDLQEIARQFYRNLADVAVESLKTLTISEATLARRVYITNRQAVEKYYHQKQSVIVVTAHQGNWEWLLVSCSAQLPFWVDAVYQKLENAFFNKLMKKIRSRFGAYMMEKGTTTREIIRRKNLTRIIAMVADQGNLPTQHTYWTEFMHQDTPFYDGPERIARKTKMPVLFVSMHRTRRGFYEITFQELAHDPFLPEHGCITERYAQAVEKTIREHPADWLWSHNRWKRKRTSSMT